MHKPAKFRASKDAAYKRSPGMEEADVNFANVIAKAIREGTVEHGSPWYYKTEQDLRAIPPRIQPTQPWVGRKRAAV